MKKYSTAGHSLPNRLLTGILLFALIAGILPAPFVTVRAADIQQDSLNKLVTWGIMRGDQTGSLNPNQPITRAEFVTMVNRAYGYDEASHKPFQDVELSAWYAEDISVARQAGYFKGKSDSIAAPNSTLTREEATVIVGRNLMFEESVGEVLGFSDSRLLENWSRGYIKAAVEHNLICGYPDGSFKPKQDITRGEVAIILTNALGRPIDAAGEYTLGGIYSNLTISSSDVTLRDTTIAGDLYITAGVGKGTVTLQNVTVLGKILVSGAGESNKGDSSVVLRNVVGTQMIVDSPANQFVTLRAEGDTEIPSTLVRTSAFLEDRTASGCGLKSIVMEGSEKIALELAGNIEDVINKVPASTLKIAQGQAKTVTMDELAVGASLIVSNGAVIKTLNLDVAVKVTGTGDVDALFVNAGGCNVSMLPDQITIRPGLTAVIGGETMDAVAAAESSEAPRLLAGYPTAIDIAPTNCSGSFSTNKSGMVYWAISSLSDGSIGEQDLITPPTYASKIVKSGNLKVLKSNTEMHAKVSGLIAGGSYYLSAVLVDSRNQRSPVKVTVFTTPDDTIPNFATGYPYLSKITNNTAQVTVMPTKTCQLYHALLPKGSTTPTPKDFKTNAVAGNLGFGSLDVTKNTTRTFTINDKPLRELETYDLYLWLTDADGAKSSAVKKVTFTTVDKTPPVFNTKLMVTSVKTNSLGLTFNLNELGTVYWVAVKEGTEYPKPLAGQTGSLDLSSEAAKLQVVSGMNALKSGKVSAAANKDGLITISGLEVQTAYDIYYVAQDKAGNYSATVEKLTANTLDNIPPTVKQEFTRYNGTNTDTPLADTDIKIIFSEGVQEFSSPLNKSLVTLYSEMKAAVSTSDKESTQKAFASALRNTIQLYNRTSSGPATRVQERTNGVTNWVIDYNNAKAEMKDGKTVVTFPTTKDANSALNLSSGSTYYFVIDGIADTSSSKNIMGVTQLKDFTTVFAQVNLATINESLASVGGNDVMLDMSFKLMPISTSKVEDSIDWDMLLWCDSSVEFELYQRVKNNDGKILEDWRQLGKEKSITNTSSPAFAGLSLTRDFLTVGSYPVFDHLNQLKEDRIYEYGIHFTKITGSTERATWSSRVNCKISIAAGSANILHNLSVNVTPNSWQESKTEGISSIGLPDEFTLKKQFTDQRSPVFVDDFPTFLPGDSMVKMTLLLDRPGTVYYVITPKGLIPTKDDEDKDVEYKDVPTNGSGNPLTLSKPGYLDIVNPRYSNSQIKTGSHTVGTGAIDLTVDGLNPKTDYYVYFVLKGNGQVFSPVFCYRFATTEVTRPKITLDIANPKVNISVSEDANVDYSLLVDGKLPSQFTAPFSSYANGNLPKTYQASTYTVLDAMTDPILEGEVLMGSVFDLYATPSSKDMFATLIRSQKTDGGDVVLQGSSTIPKGQLKTIDCRSFMSGNTWYCFLAVGKNVLGTGDAFRAIRPVFLRDTEPPMVVQCATTIEFDPANLPPKTLAEAKSRAYSGSVTVSFSEQLYRVHRNGNQQTIVPLEAQPVIGGTVSPGYTPLGSLLTFPASSTVSIKPNTGPCQIVQFTFSNLRYNQMITIGSEVGDATGNVHVNTPLNLILDVATADVEGNFIPSFAITPAWDSRK